MERHFHEELRQLKEELFKMALLVKEAIENATRALLTQSGERAEQVIAEDRVINELEIKIDDAVHRLLTLRQPMAVDMRLLTMIAKINSDLERIGDHAVNIAEKTLRIKEHARIRAIGPAMDSCPISQMSVSATQVLLEAVEAFVNADAASAQDLLKRDDEIDALYDKAYESLEIQMQEDSAHVPTCMALIMVAHDLERVGDLANNIAEDAIYLAQGKEVRHHHEA